MSHLEHSDMLSERFQSERMINLAHNVLEAEEQSEDAFLGAQAILLLNGLL